MPSKSKPLYDRQQKPVTTDSQEVREELLGLGNRRAPGLGKATSSGVEAGA